MAATPQQFGMQIGQQIKKASLATLLGGGLGAGVGGLAGGVGGGLMGAMTGGAIGGAPGAGLGLLGGGALGLGAGAHLGGNIGASIGKKKKKDDEPKAEKPEKEEKSEEAVEKEAARGDMVNKLMSYLKNRPLLQAEVVQPAGKAITGGWQTTSGVLGAPGGIHHHFSPSTVREVTTPPVLVRDLMSKAKSLMPRSGGMPERGGGYFDNYQKDLAGVVKQMYQAKKTGVR